MPKPRKALRVQLPSYLAPPLAWRKALLSAVRTAKQTRGGIVYDESDRLALNIRLYLIGRDLEKIDVDNRLKDVMDALQGQIGGGGKKIKTPRDPIIRNDRQVWRVTIEKLRRPPKLKRTAGGHLTISRFRPAS
jgi:hypothetical protein